MIVTVYQCYSKNKFPFNLFAIAIRFFSKTNYSHYAMSYTSESGNKLFCDSTGKGVRVNGEDQFLKKYTIKKTFVSRQDLQPKLFLRFLEEHLGKSYGYAQAFGLLPKILGMIKSNPFGKGAKRIICNELVILFLNRFYNARIVDTDSLDLNETEALIYRLKI